MIEIINESAVVICDAFPTALLSDFTFACITADPPYGNVSDAKWETGTDEAQVFYEQIASVSVDLLEPGGSLFLWGGIGKPCSRPFWRALLAIEDAGHLKLRNMITWSKKRAYGKGDDYLFTREELAWFVKGDKPSVFNVPLLDEKRGYAGYNKKYPAKSEFKRRTNVWTDVTEIFRNKKHPAEKPVRLYEIIYETHSRPDDLVLDICAGSGAAAIGALNVGRFPVVVESEESTAKKIIQRIEQHLGGRE